MNKFRKFVSALTLAGVMTTGMMVSTVRLEAAGFTAKPWICPLLGWAANAADTAGLTDIAQAIRDHAASIGCE